MIKDDIRYLTIKEFSQLTHTSIDTLKHYDRTGLLKPAYVGENKYRYYLPEQSLILTRILFDTHANIPLKMIRHSLENESPEETMAHYERIHAEIAANIAELQAMQGTINNMKYYYTLAKLHPEKEIFQIYLPEWFIIRSRPLPLGEQNDASDSDIANQLFLKGFYNGRWPHYLLGMCCQKEDAERGDYSNITYYLKVDHPEQFPKKDIQFIRNGYWVCMNQKVKGKGVRLLLKEFLFQLKKNCIQIESQIFIMDTVNNLLTTDPENYCTMVYALKKEPSHHGNF